MTETILTFWDYVKIGLFLCGSLAFFVWMVFKLIDRTVDAAFPKGKSLKEQNEWINRQVEESECPGKVEPYDK